MPPTPTARVGSEMRQPRGLIRPISPLVQNAIPRSRKGGTSLRPAPASASVLQSRIAARAYRTGRTRLQPLERAEWIRHRHLVDFRSADPGSPQVGQKSLGQIGKWLRRTPAGFSRRVPAHIVAEQDASKQSRGDQALNALDGRYILLGLPTQVVVLDP